MCLRSSTSLIELHSFLNMNPQVWLCPWWYHDFFVRYKLNDFFRTLTTNFGLMCSVIRFLSHPKEYERIQHTVFLIALLYHNILKVVTDEWDNFGILPSVFKMKIPSPVNLNRCVLIFGPTGIEWAWFYLMNAPLVQYVRLTSQIFDEFPEIHW